MNPDHSFAWLYLGYNAYDAGKFALASERFDRVRLDALSEYFQLKLEEIRLCCSIHLIGMHQSLDALEQFVTTAERHPWEDIFPHSLIKSFKSSVRELGSEDLARVEVAARRLDSAARLENWFTEMLPGSEKTSAP